MTIVLFGATGNIGQRIAKEALDRRHEVIGVVREPAKVKTPDPRMTLLQGDATDRASVAALGHGADAIVSAISPRPNARGLAAPSLRAAARALIEGSREAGVKRLVVVGGAGTLEVKPGVRLMDTPGFPEMFKPEAQEGAEALEVFRNEDDGLDWTFMSPAAEIIPGERTGRYRTTHDEYLADANGRSVISFDDYAVALLDELERPRHLRRRFGVAY